MAVAPNATQMYSGKITRDFAAARVALAECPIVRLLFHLKALPVLHVTTVEMFTDNITGALSATFPSLNYYR